MHEILYDNRYHYRVSVKSFLKPVMPCIRIYSQST
nr:unnamed protein product [Callosobruchus chinensis]